MINLVSEACADLYFFLPYLGIKIPKDHMVCILNCRLITANDAFMISAAALRCPLSYRNNDTPLRAVNVRLCRQNTGR